MRQILKNQSGMASIMFAIFMAIVLCLLAVGFATLVRNDQRQTLDKTLSNQATYAAESAINKIQNLYKQTVLADNQDCAGDTPAKDVSKYKTSLQNAIPQSNISITCLTWTSKLSPLMYDPVSTSPIVVPIIPDVSAISQIVITWSRSSSDNGSGNTTYGGSGNLQLSSGRIPTLRIAAARADNISNVGVVFLNPRSVGGVGTIGYGNSSGSIQDASCNASGKCTIILNLGSLWSNGFLSITSLNGSSKVTIASTNSNVYLTNAQAKIDATAKSQDVIKRLVVYAPLTTTTWQPDFTVSADYLCKNYRLDASTNAVAGPVSATTCP